MHGVKEAVCVITVKTQLAEGSTTPRLLVVAVISITLGTHKNQEGTRKLETMCPGGAGKADHPSEQLPRGYIPMCWSNVMSLWM